MSDLENVVDVEETVEDAVIADAIADEVISEEEVEEIAE